jgi:hypothetical protein
VKEETKGERIWMEGRDQGTNAKPQISVKEPSMLR